MAPATLDTLQQEICCGRWRPGTPARRISPDCSRNDCASNWQSRPPLAAFRAMIDTLLRRGTVRQDGAWLRLSTHQIRLSAADERIWPHIRALLGAERFRPPRTRDLAHALSMPETACAAR